MISRLVLAQELRGQTRRYILVALSMLLGVLGLVGVALGNSVAADLLIAQEEQLNGREATYEASARANPAAGATVIDTSITAMLDSVLAGAGARVRAAAVTTDIPGRLRSMTESEQGLAGNAVTVTWTSGAIEAMRRIPVLDGRRAAPTCLPGEMTLNEPAARVTGVRAGDQALLSFDSGEQPRYVVIAGIIADGASQPVAYGSWEQLECMILSRPAPEDSVIRFVMNPRDATTVEQLLIESLADRGLSLDGGVRRVDTVDGVRSQIEVLSTIFAVCAALLLVVSALGIASVGIAAVTERSRELLVRRAFGARRVDIFAQVIIGAVLVGAIIGVIGFAIAIGLTYGLLPSLLPVASSIVAPDFPWSAGILGLAAGVGTGLIGGAVPAVRATRLPIAEALRR